MLMSIFDKDEINGVLTRLCHLCPEQSDDIVCASEVITKIEVEDCEEFNKYLCYDDEDEIILDFDVYRNEDFSINEINI